jgi:hypothetical protein
MEADTLKQVTVMYEQLQGLYHGIDTSDTSTKNNGPVVQYRSTLQKLGELLNEDLSHFQPDVTPSGTALYYKAADLKAQVSGLLGWLRASYLPDIDKPHYAQASSPATNISQTVNQEVNVMQIVTLDVSEMLTAKQADFDEGTPERTFIERIKNGLRGVKDTAALLALIMQTAHQCGLTTDQLRSIFS